MVTEIFPGRGWHLVRVKNGIPPGISRRLFVTQVDKWCRENLGEENVEWVSGGYSGIFRVKKQHIAWFMLTWG